MSSQDQNQITLLNIDSLNDALKYLKDQVKLSDDFDEVIKIVESYKALQLCILSLDKLQKIAVEIEKKNKGDINE